MQNWNPNSHLSSGQDKPDEKIGTIILAVPTTHDNSKNKERDWSNKTYGVHAKTGNIGPARIHKGVNNPSTSPSNSCLLFGKRKFDNYHFGSSNKNAEATTMPTTHDKSKGRVWSNNDIHANSDDIGLVRIQKDFPTPSTSTISLSFGKRKLDVEHPRSLNQTVEAKDVPIIYDLPKTKELCMSTKTNGILAKTINIDTSKIHRGVDSPSSSAFSGCLLPFGNSKLDVEHLSSLDHNIEERKVPAACDLSKPPKTDHIYAKTNDMDPARIQKGVDCPSPSASYGCLPKFKHKFYGNHLASFDQNVEARNNMPPTYDKSNLKVGLAWSTQTNDIYAKSDGTGLVKVQKGVDSSSPPTSTMCLPFGKRKLDDYLLASSDQNVEQRNLPSTFEKSNKKSRALLTKPDHVYAKTDHIDLARSDKTYKISSTLTSNSCLTFGEHEFDDNHPATSDQNVEKGNMPATIAKSNKDKACHQHSFHKNAQQPNRNTTSSSKSMKRKTKNKTQPHGFDRKLEAEKIVAATDSPGELMLLMKWKGCNKLDLVPAWHANIW
jgi:hypothetical protein